MSRVISPETKLVFSNIIIRKDKNNLVKHRKDVNARKKNSCKQKDIGLIDNCNSEEHHLGTKKLHLNNKGNSVFAKSILRFIESWAANIGIFDEIRVRHILNDKPQSKFSDMRDSGEGKNLLILGSIIKIS